MFKDFRLLYILLMLLVFVAICINLNTGFISLNFSDFFSNSSQNHIAELRINRVFAMILAGIAIPTAGFLLQEYFQNPLAGPDVMGITSVASLFVAFYLLVSGGLMISEFLQNGIISIVAIIGSLCLMGLLILFSKRIQDNSYLIIFGFLISAFSGAIVSLMQLYAQNESLKNYILWSYGANSMLTKNQILMLLVIVVVGLFFCFKSIKPLMGNALGENYAKSLGVNVNQLKVFVIVASSLLSASITAFLGPILFIGIIVPHFSRLLYNPAKLWHQWILNVLVGTLVMLLFSIVSEKMEIPINVVSSVFGIPVILLMMIKRKI